MPSTGDGPEGLTYLEPQSTESTQPRESYDGPEPSIAASNDLHYRSEASDAGDDGEGAVLPRWMRERSESITWNWVPLSVRQFGRFVKDLSRGPEPPKIQRITPWLPTVQEAPLYLVDRYLPKRRYKALALAAVYGAWLLTFSLVIKNSADSGHIKGYGTPTSIWCGASLWSQDNKCGLDGNNCRPFTNSSLAFRCNADCIATHLVNERTVGDQVVNYQPFVIGGPVSNQSTSPPIYRGDSFICQAAIHAGVVSNSAGGCGVLKLTGAHHAYPASTSHGISSIAFLSDFPKSFTFDTSLPTSCGVVDQRWALLAVTVIFTSIVSLFVSSPAIFFVSVFTMLFFHVGLVSDKPNITSFPPLLSLIVERFLPASLGAYVIYRFSVRPCLTHLTAQVEKTILWLGFAWVGALNNYTFSFIPIQRLTPHDIRAQSGAVLALVVIVLSIFFIALGQAYFLWLEGRFRKYLGIYAAMGGTLIACVLLPALNLRIHHYILALLLLPGTRVQTRASLAYQGLLLGLYVNGTARWGFASILQTTAALVGDGRTDSLLPNVTASVGWAEAAAATAAVAAARNISFAWPLLPSAYDGISMLVNDVERHRWYEGEGAREWTWEGGEARRGGRDEYFRFAFMDGSRSADYTRAGVWEAGGNWTGSGGGRG